MAAKNWKGAWDLYFGPEHLHTDPSQVTLPCRASLEPFAAFPLLLLELNVQDAPTNKPLEKVKGLCCLHADQ